MLALESFDASRCSSVTWLVGFASRGSSAVAILAIFADYR